MKNIYFLLSTAIFLFIIEQGFTYELNQNCFQGPKYWCQSVEKANECNAFKHCLQTVWSTHKRFLSKDEQEVHLNAPNKCSNCIQCLTADYTRCPYIRLYQDEINQLLANNIGRKPICELLKQCDEKQQVRKPEINSFNYLNEDSRFECGIHPRNWCNTIESARHCNAVDYCLINWSTTTQKYTAKKIDELEATKNDVEKYQDQRICGFCVFVFTKVQSVIQQNSTEEAILSYLEGACNLLPQQDIIDKCLQDVDQYLPEIYNMVRNNVDPGIICRVLKACKDENLVPVSSLGDKFVEDQLTNKVLSSLKGIKMSIKPSESTQFSRNRQVSFLTRLEPRLSETSGIACELCQITLTAAKFLLENKVNQTKVLDFIESQLCSRLGTLNQTCVQYVQEEGPSIISLLIHDVDPSLVCRAMGLCLKVQVDETRVAEETKFFDLNVRNKLNCTLCKMVVENVKKKLEEKQSQAMIIDYINHNLCEKVGSSKELCKSLIDAYAPLFFEIIAKDVNATQICTMIGMCEQTKRVTNHKIILIEQENKPEQLNVKVNTTCVMCEFVINLLARVIKTNTSEAEVEKMLNYVCDKAIPVTLQKECTNFVTEYGPLIAALLAKQIDPAKVCGLMNLCPTITRTGVNNWVKIGNKVYYGNDNGHFSKKQKFHHKKDLEQDTTVSCVVCEFIIKSAISETRLDQAERLFEFSVNNICKITPHKYRAHCESIVEQHGEKLVDLMNKNSDPSIVCGKINFCKSDVEIDATEIDLKIAKPIVKVVHLDDETSMTGKLKTKNSSIECSLCIYVAQIAGTLLKENKTEEQIISELDLICNYFPASYKDQCVTFINEYAPYVLQLIASDLDPTATCVELELCDPSIINKSLLKLFFDKF